MASYREEEDPFEEDIVFDQAGLLTNTTKMNTAIRRVSSGKCALFAKTLGLCGAFFGLGLCIAIPGPTFLSPVTELQEDISPISSIYAARTSGYLIGSIIGGFLFDYFNRLFLLFISLLLTAVFITVTPWCQVFWLLQACMVFLGMTMGFLDTGGNVLCLDLWGRNSGPFMQALHFSFGLGAFVAPLLAAPFLEPTNSNILPTLMTSTIMPFQGADLRGKRAALSNENTTEMFIGQSDIWLTTVGNVSMSSVTYTTLASIEQNTSSLDIAKPSQLISTTAKSLESKTFENADAKSPPTRKPVRPKPVKIDAEKSLGFNNHEKEHVGSLPKEDLMPDPTTVTSVSPNKEGNSSTETSTSAQIESPSYKSVNVKNISKEVQEKDFEPVSSPTITSTTLKEDNVSVLISTTRKYVNHNIPSLHSVQFLVPTSDSNSSSSPLAINDTAAINYTNKDAARSDTNEQIDSLNIQNEKKNVDLEIKNMFLQGNSTTKPFAETSSREGIASTSSVSSSEVKVSQSSVESLSQNLAEKNKSSTESIGLSAKEHNYMKPLVEASSKDGTASTSSLPSLEEKIPQSSYERSPQKHTENKQVKAESVGKKDMAISKDTSVNHTESEGSLAKERKILTSNEDTSTEGQLSATTPSGNTRQELSTIENSLHKHIHPKPGTFDNDTEVINSFFYIIANRIEKYGFTKVQFTYLMVGLFVFAISLVFLGFLCHNPRDPKSKQEEGQNVKKISNKALHGLLISLMAIFFLLYVGLEVTYGQLVLAFAVHGDLRLARSTGLLIAIVFWGSFAAMRFASIFFSSGFGPITMLLLNFVFCTLGSVLLSSMASHTETALWVGTALLGIGLASVFPTGILWIERYIHVSNRVAAAFVIGASLGEMLCPLAVYRLMVNNPAMLMHSAVVINILCILTFVALRWLALRHGEKYCAASNNGYQLANQDEEEDMIDMSPSDSIIPLRRHSFSSEHRALLNGNPHRGP